MKRWIVAIIFGNLGRLFNNPQYFARLEDRLADSAPIRQLARTLVGLYQRGAWEIKQLRDKDISIKRLDSETLKKTEEEIAKKLRSLEEEWRRRQK
jgi:hypothetical protein